MPTNYPILTILILLPLAGCLCLAPVWKLPKQKKGTGNFLRKQDAKDSERG